MTSFLAIDFETSDYAADSACSIGLVRVENGIITGEYTHLIRPPRRIMRFTDVHGIRWNDVENMPTFGEIWQNILPLFKEIHFLVAHNASFDRRVLNACCEHYGITTPEMPFRCTVQVARNHFKIKPAKLSNVCDVLGIDLTHHEALSDARACAKIMIKALEEKNSTQSLNHEFNLQTV